MQQQPLLAATRRCTDYTYHDMEDDLLELLRHNCLTDLLLKWIELSGPRLLHVPIDEHGEPQPGRARSIEDLWDDHDYDRAYDLIMDSLKRYHPATACCTLVNLMAAVLRLVQL